MEVFIDRSQSRDISGPGSRLRNSNLSSYLTNVRFFLTPELSKLADQREFIFVISLDRRMLSPALPNRVVHREALG